jgi:purine-binding chemotaxis protein CheW
MEDSFMNDAKEDTARRQEVERILEERARDLSRPPKQKTDTLGESHELLVLGVGSELYGIHLGSVQEIQILRGLAPVPGTPKFWAGLINLRGRLVPALDLPAYLGLPVATDQAFTKIVVVAQADLIVALLVHEVKGVRRLPKDAIQPSVKNSRQSGAEVVTGITADLISVLDLNVLLGDSRLVVDEAAF